MKISQAFLAVLALALSSAASQAQQWGTNTPPPGRVAWWSGDGHFLDLIGTNQGTGIAGTSFAPGKVGQAFSFDGVSGYVQVANTGTMDFGAGDFTIEGWLFFNSLAGDQEIVHKVVGTVPDDRTYFLEFNLPNSLRFMVRQSAGNQNDLIVTTSLAAGQWYHVAAVRSGNTNRLFLNGSPIGVQVAGNGANTGAGGIARIGNIAPNGIPGLTRFFRGMIDELSLYNRALSAVEIASLAGGPQEAVDFTDDFSTGLNTNLWLVVRNDPTFSLTDTNEELRLSRPAGGDYSLHYMEIAFDRVIEGDFDASVDIRDASINRVDGSPGNQIQLNTGFGGQYFCAVRSDESGSGQNAHVWRAPPGSWVGTIPTTATAGTLRVQRVGSTVAAYFGGTLLHTGTYNASPVVYLALTLQNNGTRDPISVVFDNFHLKADHLVPKAACLQALGAEGNSFRFRLLNPTPGAWHWVEFAPGLPAADGGTVRGLIVGGAFPTNWTDPLPAGARAGYYRVRSQ